MNKRDMKVLDKHRQAKWRPYLAWKSLVPARFTTWLKYSGNPRHLNRRARTHRSLQVGNVRIYP